MVEFALRLAGFTVVARVLHESTRRFCSEYVVDGALLTAVDEPLRVCVTQAHIDAERERSREHDELAGEPVRDYSDAYLETLALYRLIADELIAHDTVVFHGAVVALDGRAYAFTAPSGTGKTTHLRFWLDQVPGAYVLNGDKPLLRVDGSRVLACGTPWMGKEGLGVNETLPLAGICILERGERDSIRRVGLSEAIGTLVAQTNRPQGDVGLVRSVELAGEIGGRVPLWRMGCTLDPRSALVSWGAMAGEDA